MDAVVVRERIGPDGAVFERGVAEPRGSHPMSPGQRLLLDVRAAAICFPDLLQTRGLYQHFADVPYICGSEAAGVVLEAPANSAFAAGDRVLGLARPGAMAQRALLPPGYVLRLPERLSFAEGAAVYINYCTAWYALHRAGARPGETVLLQGAAGGVGTAVLQVAHAFGVEVIAVVSSDDKEQLTRSLGAAAVVRSDGDWLEEVRGLTDGKGVHVVVDTVGGDRFTDSLRSMRIGGRLVVVGFAGGEIPTLKINRLLLRNLTLVGISMDVMDGEYPGTVAMVNEAVQRMLDDGTIRPPIGARLPLSAGAEALRIMERRQALGKIVVEVGS